ncbi:MAG: Ig-like domain repeat protein [Acidobacteriaceae bacterium]
MAPQAATISTSSLTISDIHRDVPDVSLFAGNGLYSAAWVVCSDSLVDNGDQGQPVPDCANTGGQFSSGSSFTGAGGTSAAAPAFAGILALAVQATGGRLGQADSILYQLAKNHPSYFHDIASGDNSVPCAAGSLNCGANDFLTGYDAGAGYDLASGLGSVDAAAIVKNWSSVSLGATSTTLQINGSSAAYTGVHGASLTFNIGVTGGSGTPTGIVAITDNDDMTSGGTTSGPQNNGQFAIPLTGGTGSSNYNGLPGGTYAVTARYGGDTSFADSTSTPLSVTISPESSATTLAVNAYDPLTSKAVSGTNIPYGSYVFVDATIAGTAEGSQTQGVATGTVHFLNAGTILGSAFVSSGNRASWPPLDTSFAALAAGSYNLTAQYSGDASYSASTATTSFTVTKAPTTATAGYGGTPVEYGNQEQIGADISTNSTGVAPTGTFQFYIDGQTALAPQPIYESSGYQPSNTATSLAYADAQTTYTFLAVGQHTLSAAYSGDSNYSSSTSAAVDVTVAQALPFFNGLGWNIPNPPAVIGQQTTVITQLYGSEHGAVPTGSITFYDNGNAISGTVTYDGQPAGGGVGSILKASIPYTFTTSGNHALSVSYSGDANYLSATSDFNNIVNVLGPISVSAGSLTDLTPGQSASTTVTVTPYGGYTGTVNLSCKVSTSMSSSIDLPTCSIPDSVSISGTASASATLTVVTTPPSSSRLDLPLNKFFLSGGEVALACLLFFGIPARRRVWRALFSVLVIVLITSAIGCGGSPASGGGTAGSGNLGTTKGSYAVTVAATDASTNQITASTVVTLTVN